MTGLGFDPAFLARLERLMLAERRPIPGPAAGPRRSPRHGASVEFADFRDYSPGDDFRRVDWNAFARLDRLFLRLYRAEEMTAVTIFVDHSLSMSFGEPSKVLSAARLAAVIAAIGLNAYDSVAVAGWGDHIDAYLPPRRGKAAIPEVWSRLEALIATEVSRTDFVALREIGKYRQGRGIAIVLSDLLTESDWRSGLKALLAAGQEVTLIQVLAVEELTPGLRGDWKLIDVETGTQTEVTVSPRLLRRYEGELAAYTEEIREFCRKSGIAFVRLPSLPDVPDRALRVLLNAGILR